MRISSSYFFQTGLNSINAQQADLLHLFQQTASGQRMVTPADDPLGAAQAVNLSQSQSLNQRFADNREVLKLNLGQEENVLNSATLLLQDIKTTLIDAGNGTRSDIDRQTLASVLSKAKDNLMGLANSTDGNGQYLFSGHSSMQPAFIQSDDGTISYQGDSGKRLIQADQTRQIDSGDVGSNVFGAASSGSRAYVTAAGDYNPATKTGKVNSGTGEIGAPAITDPQGANVGLPFRIEFEEVPGGGMHYNVYTVGAEGARTRIDGPNEYKANTSVLTLVGGVQVAFSGQPEDGDIFTVNPAVVSGSRAYVAEETDANTGGGVIGMPIVTDLNDDQYAGMSFRVEFNVDPAGPTWAYAVHVLDADGNAVLDEFDNPVIGPSTPYMPPAPPALASLTLSGGLAVEFSGEPADGDSFEVNLTAPATAELSVFDTLDAIIAALNTPTDTPESKANLSNVLASAMQKIDINYDQVLTVRASVGARMNEIDAIDANGASRGLSYSQQLSRLEDVDYYTVTTQLELRRAALEAAALAFKKIQGTSLFNMGSR